MPLGGGVPVCPIARVLSGASLGQLMLDARVDRRAGVRALRQPPSISVTSPEISDTRVRDDTPGTRGRVGEDLVNGLLCGS